MVSHLVYTTIGPGDNVSVPSPAVIPPFQAAASVAAKPSQLLEVASNIQSQQSQPKTVGSDQEAVEFVNRCREFIFNDTSVRKDLVNSWLEKLNEFTIKSAVDVSALKTILYFQISCYQDGLLVEFIETIEEGTAEPTITNMSVETMPNDNLVSVVFHTQTRDELYYLLGSW